MKAMRRRNSGQNRFTSIMKHVLALPLYLYLMNSFSPVEASIHLHIYLTFSTLYRCTNPHTHT